MKIGFVRFKNANGQLRWTDGRLIDNDKNVLDAVPDFVRQNAVKVEYLEPNPTHYIPYHNPALGY